MPYKKRRIIKSPNKNQEKIRRNWDDSQPMGSYFPHVERLTIDLRFLNKEGHVLRHERQEYRPNDSITFLTPCPGGCAEGETNLKAKIESAINQRMPSGEGRAQCQSALYTTGEPCGCNLECQFSVVYRDQPTEN